MSQENKTKISNKQKPNKNLKNHISKEERLYLGKMSKEVVEITGESVGLRGENTMLGGDLVVELHDQSQSKENPLSTQITPKTRPTRTVRRPKKFGSEQTPLQVREKERECEEGVEWESEDTPCLICNSMGEDNELACWIKCNFCSAWCHGVCVELEFTAESAKGIVKFICPVCRKDDSLNGSEVCDNCEDFEEEKEELVGRLDKLNLLVEQGKSEVESLKKKEKELIKQSREDKVKMMIFLGT